MSTATLSQICHQAKLLIEAWQDYRDIPHSSGSFLWPDVVTLQVLDPHHHSLIR